MIRIVRDFHFGHFAVPDHIRQQALEQVELGGVHASGQRRFQAIPRRSLSVSADGVVGELLRGFVRFLFDASKRRRESSQCGFRVRTDAG